MTDPAPKELRCAHCVAVDGPYPPTEQRFWLARKLMDSKLTDAEAFGIVRHHPDISPTSGIDTARPTPEVERERIARIIDPEAWEAHDVYAARSAEWLAVSGPDDRLTKQFRRQADDLSAPSLAKADVILNREGEADV